MNQCAGGFGSFFLGVVSSVLKPFSSRALNASTRVSNMCLKRKALMRFSNSSSRSMWMARIFGLGGFFIYPQLYLRANMSIEYNSAIVLKQSHVNLFEDILCTTCI